MKPTSCQSVPAKFSPLSHVLVYDDFDLGFNGWLDLTPNYVYGDFRQQPSRIDLGRWAPSMISAAPMRYAASHGSMEGMYSLKLSTRDRAAPYEEQPSPGSVGVAIKRLSRHQPNLRYIQMEAWYSYTPSQDREGLGEEDIRAFGFFFDLQDKESRWQPGVRYVNSVNGKLKKSWQFFQASPDVTREQWSFVDDNPWEHVGIDGLWCGRRYGDGSADAYKWVPGGQQDLVYNESPDKLNWLYMRLKVDLKTRQYVEFQSMDHVFDLRGTPVTLSPAYKGIHGLINPVFFVEADSDRPVHLFLDSIVYSTETE